MFEFKPDYERCKQRIDAFWERELIDRPVVQFGLSKPPDERVPLPVSNHTSPGERWLDVEYRTEFKLAELQNQQFLGDTMPVAWPNLGPEIFSSFYGCPIHFGDYGTSWTDPILHDWDKVKDLRFDENSPYLIKLHEMTDALLAVGKDRFIVGMTDWHPGGDAVAAFRDPQELAIDMMMHLDQVKGLLDRIEVDYFRVYDLFYQKLRAAGQPISSWTSLVCDGKYYIPSNDFSIMISKAMFDDVFLPGIRRECQFLDRSIYHLDGPGALRHLDSLLAIPELDALQWVCGAGAEGVHRWVDVYRRAQAADKAIQVICKIDELDLVIETLDPHGVFLSVSGVPDRDAAEAMLKRLERWAVGRV
ncbi:MAG: hypothetical protein JXA89_16595 [Anaerolineae bacterium]|nr:hypothetical protein [Anaerolineae bacterium]